MTGVQDDLRWDVPTADALRRLAADPLPLGLRAGPARRVFYRDLYLDTPDGALRQRDVSCRFRLRSDDRRELMVAIVTRDNDRVDLRRIRASVQETEAREALKGTSEPARVLRALVSPDALAAELELETERCTRSAKKGWLRRARFELWYDIVTVRAAGLARTFQELAIRELHAGRPNLVDVVRAVREGYGLRSVTADRKTRGMMVRSALESEALARGVGSGKWLVVIALDGPRAACIVDVAGAWPRLPAAEGSGEEGCRHLLRSALGSAVGDLHLVSSVAGEGRLRSLDVWVATHLDRSTRPSGTTIEWLPLAELLERADTSRIVDAPTLAALAVLARSELLPRLLSADVTPRGTRAVERRPSTQAVTPREAATSAEPLLDGELSLLEFNDRVLALAEDESMPLLERVRFLSIVSANLDEFFMVRMGGLKYGSEEVAAESGEGSALERAEAIRRRARAIIARGYQCFEALRPALATHGIHIRAPGELDTAAREYLRTYFRSTIFPYLTPRAITSTPGHSLPVIPALGLSLAVVVRDERNYGPLRLADLAIPPALPRFVQLPGGNEFVAIEDVIRAELKVMYPGRHVEDAHLFRVTRHASLEVDERRSGNLVQAIEEGTQRRRHQPVVRIEVERAMPASLRDLLVYELQLEPGSRPGALSQDDVYAVDGAMDLGALRQLAGLPLPELRFPPFHPRPVFDRTRSLWDTLRERDVLLHHPYDDFATTVERFFDDAADDPDVASIKVTLYRAGERSPIVDALLRAAKAGKDVAVFVELKARFDEQRNVTWARRLEAAGIQVAHGVLGAKNHAKCALVIRREHGVPRRYVHVGTGNYNGETARFYTDLGLLTSGEHVCADVNDLFNVLTGSSAPSDHLFRECLVAPHGLLPALIERIDREAAHARAGRVARIRMKVNGLSDRDVVTALYRAARAGVEIDLIVRGICTLCPGAPGAGGRIRVVSLLGRFLEHARIFSFENGGEREYFIGSADLRPRNLRRRVEVLAPVRDAELCARLDAILDRELADPLAWELSAEGTYTRRKAAPATPERSEPQRQVHITPSAPATAEVT
jgi:polyphosphate kinase